MQCGTCWQPRPGPGRAWFPGFLTKVPPIVRVLLARPDGHGRGSARSASQLGGRTAPRPVGAHSNLSGRRASGL
eukprot:4857108-Alexandrium_andersonii.AAC.1